jgi:hypothetical protein
MSIHEKLPRQLLRALKQVGWSKARELAKLAQRQGQHFDCAQWLHKAQELPFDRFQQEIERALNGPDAEPWDLIYFKLYKSQLPVIEQALDVAARMLGSDRSRGYCLEMICADFLAGANVDGGDPELLLLGLQRAIRFLTPGQRERFGRAVFQAEAA